jgi:hypothetical protein
MPKTDAKSESFSRSSRGQLQTILDISPALFSDDAVHRIIDEWLVPALVDQFLRSPKNHHPAQDSGHNRDSP